MLKKKGRLVAIICCVIFFLILSVCFSICKYMLKQHNSFVTGRNDAAYKTSIDHTHQKIEDAQAQKSQFLFTVIMPTYNRRFCIEKAINSLLNQTNQNFQLIIIDDGSTDNTEELIKVKYSAYLKSKKFIYKYIKHKGVCNARNTALKLAKTDWIAYLDTDNEIFPDFIDTFQKAIAEHPKYKCFYAKFVADGNIEGQAFNYSDLVKLNFIDMGVFVHRRNLINKYGMFDVKLKRATDWDLILRYTKKDPPYFIDKVVLKYNTDDSFKRISNSENKFINHSIIRCKLYINNLKEKFFSVN